MDRPPSLGGADPDPENPVTRGHSPVALVSVSLTWHEHADGFVPRSTLESRLCRFTDEIMLHTGYV